jgi:predicted PurR-regulated permease PerM
MSLLKSLQFIFFTALVLYFGRDLFVPMCYGLLIAIVLYPVCRWLERHQWPRSLSITAGLLIVFTLFSALITVLVIQANIFGKDLPEFLNKLDPSLYQLQKWIESCFGISVKSQNEWKQNAVQNFGNNVGNIAQTTLSSAASTLFTLFLVPVYSALFLYNRGAFVKFLSAILGKKYHLQLQTVLQQVIHTYFNFIKGMALVYLVVGILNSIGLMALGIRHAILFGMLTAIMTIIPYVGIIISALLPISIAWITKDSVWYPLGVIGVFAFVQYLEANVIFPKIVGAQLKVSTWATLVAIIAGGILWGVSGMILFIPFIGILKIIFDYIPEGKTFNILLGRDEENLNS